MVKYFLIKLIDIIFNQIELQGLRYLPFFKFTM